MQQPNKKITLLAAAVTATFGITSVQAAGFRLPEVSVLGVGTSNAMVANTNELGALPYNPANMAFHDTNGLVAGVTYIGYDLKVDTTVQGGTGGQYDSTGDDSFYVPNIYAMAPGYGKWSFGIGINAPFGLETSWQAGTFANFKNVADIIALVDPQQAAVIQSSEPELSRIEMLNFNPNFAYKFNDTTSVAVGIDFYDLRDLRFNTQGLKVSGSGTGLGWNVGFTKKLGNVNLGLSYRSSVDTDISGVVDASALGAPPLTATTSTEFPDMLQFGAYWQATDKLGVELDAEYTGWSSFDKIEISWPGPIPLTSTNNWQDTWAVRLGGIYAITPKTKLLLGYSFDETAQTQEYFSARVPDNERQLFSIGLTHAFAGWTLEAAYMYVDIDDRTYNADVTYLEQVTVNNSLEANGTDAYDGKYESSVNLISIGLSTRF